jgi:hypothetical protein
VSAFECPLSVRSVKSLLMHRFWNATQKSLAYCYYVIADEKAPLHIELGRIMSREQFASGKAAITSVLDFDSGCGAHWQKINLLFRSADDKVSSVQVLLLARRRRQNSRFRRLHYISHSLSLSARGQSCFIKYED